MSKIRTTIFSLFLAVTTVLSIPCFADDTVNINTADLATLTTLKGVGASKAQAIITYRHENGPFKRPGDLSLVKGISDKMVRDLKDQITLK